MAVKIATNLWVNPSYVVCVRALAHGVELQFANGTWSSVPSREGCTVEQTADDIAKEIWPR